jgi:hypothetical protein
VWARVSTVVIAASLCVAGLSATGAAAQAPAPFVPSSTVLDPAGDVPLQQGDILAAGFAATATSLVFGMQVAKPTDPATDPSWVKGFAFIYWQIDTTNDDIPDDLLQAVPNGDGTTSLTLSAPTPHGFDIVCENKDGAVLTYIADYGYTLSFPKRCMPADLTFRFQAAMMYQTVNGPAQPTDIAPSDSTYSDPVKTPAKSVPVTPAGGPNGYWMLGADGHVYPFGGAVGFSGLLAGAVAMTPRRDGKGYWVADAFGRVFAHGTAVAFPGVPQLHDGESITTIAATATGKGYWLFSNRGRVFPFGDAHSHGDLAAKRLNGSIVASTATASGNGYYMVGSDGGIFAFGDAHFHGSTGALALNRPVVGMAPTPAGTGYWLVASDGGVFAFDAPFRGSMGGAHLNESVDGIVAYGNGYLMAAADGGIFDFSNRAFLGSLAAHPPAAPIIGLAAFSQ